LLVLQRENNTVFMLVEYEQKHQEGGTNWMSSVAARAPFSTFVDRTREPSRASVRRALAEARPTWDAFKRYLAETYGLKGLFHFMYGERYGWALQFRRSGRFVLAMYPNQGHLTVQIILNRAQVATATGMGLPSRVLKVLEAAKDYPEGRWLFIPVRSQKGAEELKPLVALKMSRP
jgi:hypothetical protein